MSVSWRTIALPAVATAAALSAVLIGPPVRDPYTTVTPAELSSWCARRFGPGDAVFVRGSWQCAHQDSGFFVMSPIEPTAVCGQPAESVGTISSDNQGIRCDGQ